MKRTDRLPGAKSKTPLITKIALALLFFAGAALLFMGQRGREDFSRSEYSTEDAYRTIYALSRHTDALWENVFKGDFASLGEAEKDLRALCASLASSLWDRQAEGGASRISDIFEKEDSEDVCKLLYPAYLVNPPKKINPSNRKLIVSVPEKEQREFRLRLLRCALDDTLPLPEEAAAAVGDSIGSDRQALLMLSYFISANKDAVGEDVQAFKQSVRAKGAQLTAFEEIARGKFNPFRQFVVTHASAVMLLGAMTMADVILLFAFMLSEKLWKFDVKWLLMLLVVDFLVFFQLLPLLVMLWRVFSVDGAFSFDNLKSIYTDKINLEALKNTLIAAFSTMMLGTLIAFPLAFLVGRTNLYGKKLFRTLFVLTYMVPPYVGAMAWLRLLNPNVGSVNVLLRGIFSLGDAPGPLNVYTLPGLVWVLTTFYYPYAFITISRAMEKMDPSLEEASRASGASPFMTVLKVTLPMMTPSLAAGALLVFVAAASCYGIPSIVGIPGSVHTVTTRIVEYGQVRIDDATALSVFLLAVSLIFLLLSDLIPAKKKYITVSGKSVTPTVVDLRAWRVPLTAAVGLFGVLVALVPFATILTTSLKTDIGKSVFTAGNFTFDNWKAAFTDRETPMCLTNSLVYAAVAATVGMVFSCTMGYLNVRTQLKGRSIPAFLIALGSGTPSVVIALSLIMTMTGNFGVDIHDTATILIVAYMIKYMMMGMRTVVSAMSQIHVSLEESSRISGAGWFTTMRRVTVPLIFPSVAAGWFLIFIPSFYELSMTTMLKSAATKTVGFKLYEYWTVTSQQMSCTLAFSILLIVVLLNLLLSRLTKGRFSI